MRDILMIIRPMELIPFLYTIRFTDNSLVDETFVAPKDLTIEVMKQAKVDKRGAIYDYMTQDEQPMVDLMGSYLKDYPFN